MDGISESLAATTDHTTAVSEPRRVTAHGSELNISGSRSRFAEETAQLLLSRLRAASLILALTLAVALGGALFLSDWSFIALRAVVLAIMTSAALVLRSRHTFSLHRLRLLELAIFGALVTQISAMLWSTLNRFAEVNDFVTAIGGENVYLAEFSVVILIYGMLMPNTWRRAAAILFPIACVPYAIIYVSQSRSEHVSAALESDHFGLALPLPFISALAAVYGTSIINSVRREAFRARQFGQYRLKELIGRGGMGDVYRAEHLLLKRPCAIKLIKERTADPTALALFETEVQSTAKLTHWNAVAIFDYGHTDDGVFYYVMEYLDGLNLEELVERFGPIPAARAVHLLQQICRALREAHSLGLVHRDLKPANIFAAKVGGTYDVGKLLDFGLVRPGRGDSFGRQQCVQGGRFGGSPLYMPPEQIEEFHQVDGRGDIYALGAVAYFLLTGRPPFQAANAIEVLLAHANEAVVPPSQLAPTIPGDLESIVLRCLEKRPELRFQDIESLEHALSDCGCADDWTDHDAAHWWHDNLRTTIQARRDPNENPI